MRDYPNILVAFLSEFDEGHTFERWPHHITILPWFKANKEALAGVESISKDYLPISLELAKTAMFGTRSDIIVRLVESESLKRFHAALLSERKGLLGLASSSYVLNDFRPHVTLQGQNDPDAGSFEISYISLVKKVEPDKTKQIIKNYKNSR